MSIKERIKNAKDLKTEIVKIPEWDNVEIEVRTMTGSQRAEMYSVAMSMEDGKFDQKSFQTAQIIASCYDPETGQPIFTKDDASWLMEKSSGPLEKLINKIAKVSGLTRNALELAEKN